MAAPKRIFPRFRLVRRQGSALFKSAVMAAIALSTVTLFVVGAAVRSENAKTRQLQEQALRIGRDNQELTRQIDTMGSVESIKRIATQVLGLVDPDAVFFCPVEPTNPS